MAIQKKFILAIDQSTSASKILLFNQKAELVKRLSFPHKQYYPQDGFVEHDAVEIFNNVVNGLRQLVTETQISLLDVAGIAITNQRETSVIWDKTTGIPVYNAVVWQCQRGIGFCTELRNKGYNGAIREKTGLIIDPYFSASKLHWIVKNVADAENKAKHGDLLLGTMDSWLLWKLTGGAVHATDYSNACRTMLFNINTLLWDTELIELFGLHISMFPMIKNSDEIFGYTAPDILPGSIIPISGLMGDSHAALFGQNCFLPGMAKATYGTGSSIMMNIGSKPLSAPEGLVTSIGYRRKKEIAYVFEGNIHCTGDSINWLKNELQLITSASETESLASSVVSNNGVYLVPAFVGLGAPYWDNKAKASITGIRRDTNKAHIVRAALESIAYQVKDLIDLMIKEGKVELKEIRADGGPTRNNFLMQFQSDMLGCEVVRSNIEEISALGATYMAGLATGFWNDIEKIKTLYSSDRVFTSQRSSEENNMMYSGWKKAVERTRL